MEDIESDDGGSVVGEARRSPSRFLADFTLGFADGLTVPFALTAGLSSLGQTSTVIYAGMAELCAGCISMGIGGYLAAKGEQRSETDDDSDLEKDDEEMSALYSRGGREVADYLVPLQLPPDLLQAVMAHIESSPDIAARVRDTAKDESPSESTRTSPIISGLSITLGYLLGGLLPLAPYFFVTNVAQGLRWSFGICLVALFVFGFTKEYILNVSSARHEMKSSRARWNLIKRSLREGLTMVVLGGIAALAAVVAVRLFDGGAA
ncbi:Ccc1 family [Nemania sp. NC0429]|nr:Ccc1 family [Nemania sp. NC0429]